MEEPQTHLCHRRAITISDMASKLRELARQFRFSGTRQELLDLAARYQRRADGLNAATAASSYPDHR